MLAGWSSLVVTLCWGLCRSLPVSEASVLLLWGWGLGPEHSGSFLLPELSGEGG